MYASFKPGIPWKDTNGNLINAHGGSIFVEGDTYYWIGEDKSHTAGKGKIWTWGIRIYSSKDLYNWEDLGHLVEPDLKNKKSIFHPTRRLDRPHLIFNRKTKTYVLWVKYNDDASYAVLTSDKLRGSYEIKRSAYRPFGAKCGDFDLAVDENGDAYLFFDANHTDLWGAKLSQDYTEVVGDKKIIYTGLYPPYSREGVTHFERNGKHYLLTSGITGYIPNPSEYAIADSILGEYRVVKNPHVGDDFSSFNSQVSCIFKVMNKELYIAIADRWIPDFVVTKERYESISRAIASRFDRTHKATLKEKLSLLKMPFMGKANTSKATYVWLPLVFDGDEFSIEYLGEWRI